MELTKEPIPCPSYTTNTTLHSFADQPHMIVRDVPTKILKQLPDSTMRHFKLQLGIWVRATRPFWTSMPTMLSLLWVMMFASNWAQGCGTRMKNAINYITLAVKFRHIGFAQIVPNRTCTWWMKMSHIILTSMELGLQIPPHGWILLNCFPLCELHTM